MGQGKSKEGAPAKKAPKRGQSVTAQDRATLDVKNARDKLRKYQKQLQTSCDVLTENARKLLQAGKKDRAIMALKLKKLKIQRVEQADAQILNLEEVLSNIEWTTAQQQVVEGLKQGNAILKKMQQEVSIDDVEQLMEDTREAQATQEEISQALGGGELSMEDEEACLAELAEIEKLEADELAAQIPVAPTTELPGGSKEPATVDPSTVELLDKLPEAPSHDPAAPAPAEKQPEKELVAA